MLLHRGMKVKHALIACDQSLYDAAGAGDLAVRDASGFNVGLEGSLRDGAKIYTGKPDEVMAGQEKVRR